MDGSTLKNFSASLLPQKRHDQMYWKFAKLQSSMMQTILPSFITNDTKLTMKQWFEICGYFWILVPFGELWMDLLEKTVALILKRIILYWRDRIQESAKQRILNSRNVLIKWIALKSKTNYWSWKEEGMCSSITFRVFLRTRWLF